MMDVTLNPELEKFVHYKIESGLYQSPSELVNEALRLLWEREQARIEDLLLESEHNEETPITKSDWKEIRRKIQSGGR